jgi:HSP20 family protein
MTRYRFAAPFDPVAGLLNLQREVERAFGSEFGSEFGPSGRGVFPPANVFRNDDGLTIRLEVPGVSPSDLKVETRDNTVTVSGSRVTEIPEGASYHRRERGTGKFARALQLPRDVDPGSVQATCKNGILTIKVSKREEAKPRQISIAAA